MKGIVIKSTGSWYSVLQANGEKTDCRIKGLFRIKGIKTTNPIAVGDEVEFVFEEGKNTGMITAIEERKNYIIRKAINLSKQSHIIAANIDQAFLIVTVIKPRTSAGFIDRFLATCEAYRIPVNIIFNKTDLLNEQLKNLQKETISVYEKIEYRCFEISAIDKENVTQITNLCKGKINLISGLSGTGKSTIINAFEPKLNLKTNAISTHEKGMHTTTFAEMFPLSKGGFIIDTPGVQEFGMFDIKKEELSHYFREIFEASKDCKYNSCLHIDEPKCAVRAALERNEIANSRYYSYMSILNSDEMGNKY